MVAEEVVVAEGDAVVVDGVVVHEEEDEVDIEAEGVGVVGVGVGVEEDIIRLEPMMPYQGTQPKLHPPLFKVSKQYLCGWP